MDYQEIYITNKFNYLQLIGGGSSLVVAKVVHNWIDSNSDLHLTVKDLKKLQDENGLEVAVLDTFNKQREKYDSGEKVKPNKFFEPNKVRVTCDKDLNCVINKEDGTTAGTTAGTADMRRLQIQIGNNWKDVSEISDLEKFLKKNKTQKIGFGAPMMRWKDIKGIKVYWAKQWDAVHKMMEK